MNVHWTHTAERHLEALHDFIARDSVQYARRMVDKLTQRSLQISEYPFSGRKVPEYDAEMIREVIEGPYRLIYHIKPDQIDVLAIIHGAMNILES